MVTEWGEQWEVDKSESRLKDHLIQNPHTGPMVKIALIQISNITADFKQLRKVYKFDITPASRDDLDELNLDHHIAEDVLRVSVTDLERRETRMSLLKRARFVLKDGDGLKELCRKLAGYNDALLKMCSVPVEEVIQRAMLNFVMKNQDQNLSGVVTAARTESQRRAQSFMSNSNYTLLEKTARFKIKLKELDQSLVNICEMSKYYIDSDWQYNRGEATMAISKDSQRVRYIVSQSSRFEMSLSSQGMEIFHVRSKERERYNVISFNAQQPG